MPRTRRRLPLAFCAVAALLALTTAPAALAAPGEATNYLIDAARTSAQPSGGPSGAVQQRWSRELGLHVDYALTAEGRVFALRLTLRARLAGASASRALTPRR